MLRRPLQLYVAIMLLSSASLAIVQACNSVAAKRTADDIRLLLPKNITDNIYLSSSNLFNADKAELGRYFFYDRRLSVNQSKSCSSCHDPLFSFTDGYRRSIGALGDNTQHNAPALINIIFNRYLTAADSTLHFPEEQIRNPMFHTKPVELGWEGNETMLIDRIKNDSFYRTKLPALFAAQDPFTIKNIQACISNFIKTLISFDAAYDGYLLSKDSLALSPSQWRGRELFFSDKLHCASCHGGINFSVPQITERSGSASYYQNTGLYNLDDSGSYPASDPGLYALTRQLADMGKFRIPTLRNLAFTAPYFHDGTAASLEDVINTYARGGRNVKTGPNRGDGRRNPHKNPLLQGFTLIEQEKQDLVNFLLSLSDSTVRYKKAFSNPFAGDETMPHHR